MRKNGLRRTGILRPKLPYAARKHRCIEQICYKTTPYRKLMSKYWAIKWRAEPDEQGERLSSRRFETFLRQRPGLKSFEAYGFRRVPESFDKVRRGHIIFCYQVDDGRYVAACEVKKKKRNAPGGLCLILIPKEVRLAPQEVTRFELPRPTSSLQKLGRSKAEKLCHAFELDFAWPA